MIGESLLERTCCASDKSGTLTQQKHYDYLVEASVV